MKWIALDIGTKNTGYSIYIEKNNKPKLINHGFFSIRGQYARDRFPGMLIKLTDLVHKEKPNFIVVESFYGGKNFKSVEYLAKLQGWVEGECILGDYIFVPIAAQSWRKGCGMLTGRKKNNEKQSERTDYKLMARNFAISMTKDETMTEDECDAICIGYGAYDYILSSLGNKAESQTKPKKKEKVATKKKKGK